MLIFNYPFGNLYNRLANSSIKIVNYNITYTFPICYLIAGILFFIAILSDLLDGYIARHYNQVTSLGKFFDPIAAKLLTNSVLITFTCANIVPI